MLLRIYFYFIPKLNVLLFLPQNYMRIWRKADVRALEARARKGVWVQVPLFAPFTVFIILGTYSKQILKSYENHTFRQELIKMCLAV